MFDFTRQRVAPQPAGLDFAASPTPLMQMPDLLSPEGGSQSQLDLGGLGTALSGYLGQRGNMNAAHKMYDSPIKRPPFQTLGAPMENA